MMNDEMTAQAARRLLVLVLAGPGEARVLPTQADHNGRPRSSHIASASPPRCDDDTPSVAQHRSRRRPLGTRGKGLLRGFLRCVAASKDVSFATNRSPRARRRSRSHFRGARCPCGAIVVMVRSRSSGAHPREKSRSSTSRDHILASMWRSDPLIQRNAPIHAAAAGTGSGSAQTVVFQPDRASDATTFTSSPRRTKS